MYETDDANRVGSKKYLLSFNRSRDLQNVRARPQIGGCAAKQAAAIFCICAARATRMRVFREGKIAYERFCLYKSAANIPDRGSPAAIRVLQSLLALQ